MPRPPKPIPRTAVEIEQTGINPYLTNIGKPDINQGSVFTKNRAYDISHKNDNVKDIAVSLTDIDNAIYYYFNNVIKPTVIQNNTRVPVPILYGSSERWKAVQNDGYYRDSAGKIMAPLIMYYRTSIEKNRELGNKLDGNKTHLFQTFETRYNSKNFYDNFSVLTNRIPSKQYYVSVVPDYITVSYDCVLFTNYTEQNNKLIEAIEYASDSYWGDYSRWNFRVKIDSFDSTTIMQQGEDMSAKTNFKITLNGYLIPETINKRAAASSMYYSPAQIVFGLETVENINDINPTAQMPANNTVGSTSFIGDGNIIYNTNINAAALGDLVYLNTNKPLKADTITVPNQALFTGASILNPLPTSQLPATTINNFIFYINGQYVPSSIVSFVVDGAGIRIQFDTSLLGYSLEADDEVIAIGKFQ
jgi:hypothetical protein